MTKRFFKKLDGLSDFLKSGGILPSNANDDVVSVSKKLTNSITSSYDINSEEIQNLRMMVTLASPLLTVFFNGKYNNKVFNEMRLYDLKKSQTFGMYSEVPENIRDKANNLFVDIVCYFRGDINELSEKIQF